MEIELIKYLSFLLWFAIVLWLLKLWLQSNKKKREQKQNKDEQLKIQKELHSKAVLEKAGKE